jgi:hypothetical protein
MNRLSMSSPHAGQIFDSTPAYRLAHDFAAVRVSAAHPAAPVWKRLRVSLNEESLDWQSESADEAGGTEPAGAEPMQSKGAAVLSGAQTGGTNCDASTGTITTTVTNNEPCTKDCSASHEQKHAADIGPCCTKAGAAAKKADKQEDKDAIQSKFNDWMLTNVNFLECRAYGVSVSCGEAKHTKLKCPESSYNDKCCVPLARYIRSARLQKEGTCNNAGEKLTDCPFT